MPTVYPSLNIGASRRLAIFKREAEKPRPYLPKPFTWRDVRFAKLNSRNGLHGGYNEDSRGNRDAIWYCHDSAHLPGRWVKDCHDIEGFNSRHTGWYTDIDCNDLAIGIVIALPHGRFLAGYRLTDNGEYVIYGDIYDNESDAAYAADGHAERIADREREHDARFMEMQEAEYHVEGVISDVRDAIAHRNEPRNSRHDPREWLRDRIEELRAARRDVELATEAYNH